MSSWVFPNLLICSYRCLVQLMRMSSSFSYISLFVKHTQDKFFINKTALSTCQLFIFTNHEKSKRFCQFCNLPLCVSVDRIDMKSFSNTKLFISKILDITFKYRPGQPFCDLCIQEKLSILKLDGTKMLQENENFIRKCSHKRKFLYRKFADEDEVHLLKSSEYPNIDNEHFCSDEISKRRKGLKLEEASRMLEGVLTG